MMDLREVLAAKMAAAMAGGDDEAPPARPDMRAQRLELLARFKRHSEQHEFTSGQLVVEKDGLGVISQTGGGRALIFWRKLDPDDAVDASIIEDATDGRRLSRVDCLVATVESANDGTSALLFASHESARLRPLTPEEQAELDAVRGEDVA